MQPEPTPAEDTFDGGKFNPDELPEELRPGWRQLQAAFTQKTQELAAQRQQFEQISEAGVDPSELLGLYSRVADPQQWPTLAKELAEAAQQYGVDLGFAPAEAPAPVEQPQTPELPSLDSIPDDPEFAPLKALLKEQHERADALAARLDQFESSRQEEAARAEQERMQQAFFQEFGRMEAAVQAEHPEWGEDDMNDVYQLSSFYGGDLVQAAQAKVALEERAVAAYIQRKSAAAPGSQPAPKHSAAAPPAEEEPMTVREAEAGALEYFRAALADAED